MSCRSRFAIKKLVVLPKVETIADGLAAKATGRLNLSIVRHCVDQIILVSDQEHLEINAVLAGRGKDFGRAVRSGQSCGDTR